MTIKFNGNERMANAKTALVEALKSDDEKVQSEAFGTYLDTLQKEISENVQTQANAEMSDRSILQSRGHNVLTSEERKFFNEVIDKKGFDDDAILPVTTQERIFEDLVGEHPLLAAIGLEDLGAVTRIIEADPEFAFVWGDLFGPIRGQIGSAFKERRIDQLKGTAFAVIPNDMLELGPEWVERYVRAILTESVSIGLEKAFILGKGPAQQEPVGLIKDVDPETGAVSDKVSSGTLTFVPGKETVLELKGVVKGLSRRVDGKIRRVAGKVVMVVNPFDYFDIVAASTTQNANGVYVSNLPFNPTIVESEFVDEGSVIFFVRGEYKAVTAGGYRLKRFTETLAMEDATLYTIKQFANGKPKDNTAAAVYTLAIEGGASEPAGA
ncbi:phage major capsid family protein [Planococcus plakortidis]